jgi:hypothetical protein
VYSTNIVSYPVLFDHYGNNNKLKHTLMQWEETIIKAVATFRHLSEVSTIERGMAL